MIAGRLVSLSVAASVMVMCFSTSPPDRVMMDAFRFWSALRDKSNGLWCDRIDFKPHTECDGSGYSSAGVGMGLVSDALFAELGLLPAATARANSLQTLRSLARWPHDGKHGFYVHFTDSTFTKRGGAFSTVDTAELVLGALLAGNVFGGDVLAAARSLAESVNWMAAMNLTDGSIVGRNEYRHVYGHVYGYVYRHVCICVPTRV